MYKIAFLLMLRNYIGVDQMLVNQCIAFCPQHNQFAERHTRQTP